MKIVIIIDSMYNGNGGVVATKRIGMELMARGHQVSIVCTGTPKGEFDYYEVPGFYLPFVRESLEKMNFKFGRGKKSVLRKAYQGADIVQIQFPFFLARNAVKVAKKMGIPVFGAFHVQPQNIIAAMGKEDPKMEKMLNAFFKFTLFKRVDVIHSPSQFGVELLKGQGVDAHYRVISNGIPKEYHYTKVDRPDWFGRKFVILNVGRHAMEKRQELLINGVLKSKYKDNIQLILCGKGENTLKLQEMGKQLPIKPLIEYASENDKLIYLNSTDLYLHGSVVELESLTCLEAIGCGLPSLIANSPYSAAPQFALDDRFLFKVDDVDDLAKKIDYWYENRKELEELKSDVVAMSDKYRMENCVTELENLYEDVINYYGNNRDKTMDDIIQARELNGKDVQLDEKGQVTKLV